MRKYLVVAGNIGAGKSSLVRLLSDRLGCKPYYEPVGENPYLEDFYEDMRSWAFHSQLFFLGYRLRSHRELSRERQSVVQDRSVYEDAEVFARNLREQGTMSERDWETYYGLYRTMTELLPAPDLVVYIQASVETLRARIAERGRAYEAGISEEYLSGLEALYERWIEAFSLAPVLVVPGDKLDFVARPGDLEAIAETVEERLRDRQGSLFPFGMG